MLLESHLDGEVQCARSQDSSDIRRVCEAFQNDHKTAHTEAKVEIQRLLIFSRSKRKLAA
jgi:hypothetical protein